MWGGGGGYSDAGGRDLGYPRLGMVSSSGCSLPQRRDGVRGFLLSSIVCRILSAFGFFSKEKKRGRTESSLIGFPGERRPPQSLGRRRDFQQVPRFNRANLVIIIPGRRRPILLDGSCI